MRTRTNGVTACASCATGSSSGTGSGQVGPSGGRKAQAVPRLSAEQGSFLGCLCPAGRPSARDLGLSRTVYSPAVKADICEPRGGSRSCATAAICRAAPLPRLPACQTQGARRSIKPPSCPCLVWAAGPFWQFRHFVKRQGTNLFPLKHCCVKRKFLDVFNSSVTLQYFLFVYSSYLCVFQKEKKSIPSCNGNRKGFSIFNRLTFKRAQLESD